MENLEGKYFENVIAALKNEKEQQEFVVRDNFKEELRSELWSRAVSLHKEAYDVDNWADWVLKNKFFFAGVPAFAALALVAVNSMGWGTVHVPTDQILPDAMVSVYESDSTEVTEDKDVEVVQTSNEIQKPKIVTFSADLVMPPADVLANRFVRVTMQTDVVESDLVEDTITESTTDTYTFFDKVPDSAKIVVPDIPVKSYYSWSPQESLATPVRVFSEVLQVNTDSRPDWSFLEKYNPTVIEKPVKLEVTDPIRAEESGLVESLNVEQPTGDRATESQSELGELGGAEPPVIADDTLTMEPMTSTQPVLLNVDRANVLNDVDLATMVNDDANVMTSVEEFVRVTPPLSIAPAMIMLKDPAKEVGDRIIYDGENRDLIVPAILQELTTFETSLSEDHYVLVERLQKNTYKATLYENAKVSRIWIIAEVHGAYRVVTEIIP